MEKSTWSVIDTVTCYDLDNLENAMTLEELREMKRKMNEVIGTIPFRDGTERMIAERGFKLGYLANQTEYMKP